MVRGTAPRIFARTVPEQGSMKRSTWIALGVLALLVIYAISLFNRVKRADNGVNQAWGQVEVEYQARADKTKNLVEIVKGSADFESKTLKDVVEARARATSITLDADNLTPENIQAFQEAQDSYTGSLSRLLANIEAYPNLKTTDAFRDFQAQYEGMENRIAVARGRFNEAVGGYNNLIITFPGNLYANMFGFKEKGFFKEKTGTEEAPPISFDK
jgi:LemA protein